MSACRELLKYKPQARHDEVIFTGHRIYIGQSLSRNAEVSSRYYYREVRIANVHDYEHYGIMNINIKEMDNVKYDLPPLGCPWPMGKSLNKEIHDDNRLHNRGSSTYSINSPPATGDDDYVEFAIDGTNTGRRSDSAECVNRDNEPTDVGFNIAKSDNRPHDWGSNTASTENITHISHLDSTGWLDEDIRKLTIQEQIKTLQSAMISNQKLEQEVHCLDRGFNTADITIIVPTLSELDDTDENDRRLDNDVIDFSEDATSVPDGNENVAYDCIKPSYVLRTLGHPIEMEHNTGYVATTMIGRY